MDTLSNSFFLVQDGEVVPKDFKGQEFVHDIQIRAKRIDLAEKTNIIHNGTKSIMQQIIETRPSESHIFIVTTANELTTPIGAGIKCNIDGHLSCTLRIRWVGGWCNSKKFNKHWKMRIK